MVNAPLARGVSWWAIVLRGVVAILFGLAAFAWPGLTLAALVALFGAYALIDGVFTLIAVARGHVEEHRAWMIVEGVVGILAGIFTFFYPSITAVVLVYVIAAWAIMTGVAELLAGLRLRQAIANEWVLLLAGVASLVFGVVLMVQPAAGALALVWLIGGYAFVFGVLMLILGFRLHGALT